MFAVSIKPVLQPVNENIVLLHVEVLNSRSTVALGAIG